MLRRTVPWNRDYSSRGEDFARVFEWNTQTADYAHRANGLILRRNLIVVAGISNNFEVAQQNRLIIQLNETTGLFGINNFLYAREFQYNDWILYKHH